MCPRDKCSENISAEAATAAAAAAATVGSRSVLSSSPHVSSFENMAVEQAKRMYVRTSRLA